MNWQIIKGVEIDKYEHIYKSEVAFPCDLIQLLAEFPY